MSTPRASARAQTSSSEPVVFCCAEHNQPEVRVASKQLGDGFAVQFVAGVDLDLSPLATAVQDHEGRAWYVLCRSDELDEYQVERIRAELRSRHVSPYRIMVIDFDPKQPLALASAVRLAVARARASRSDRSLAAMRLGDSSSNKVNKTIIQHGPPSVAKPTVAASPTADPATSPPAAAAPVPVVAGPRRTLPAPSRLAPPPAPSQAIATTTSPAPSQAMVTTTPQVAARSGAEPLPVSASTTRSPSTPAVDRAPASPPAAPRVIPRAPSETRVPMPEIDSGLSMHAARPSNVFARAVAWAKVPPNGIIVGGGAIAFVVLVSVFAIVASSIEAKPSTAQAEAPTTAPADQAAAVAMKASTTPNAAAQQGVAPDIAEVAEAAEVAEVVEAAPTVMLAANGANPEEDALILAAIASRKVRSLDLLLAVPSPSKRMRYGQAMAYCAAMNIEGLGGWRVPTVGELNSLRLAKVIGRDTYWSQTKADSFGDNRLVVNTRRSRISSVRQSFRGARAICVRSRAGEVSPG